MKITHETRYTELFQIAADIIENEDLEQLVSILLRIKQFAWLIDQAKQKRDRMFTNSETFHNELLKEFYSGQYEALNQFIQNHDLITGK